MTSRQSKLQEDTNFRVMRILQENPKITQRELASKLGLSLGCINYCLSALVDKGLVKAKNFSENRSKLKYAYLLTSTGIREKTTLTYRFLRRKMQEYEELESEIDRLMSEVDDISSKSKSSHSLELRSRNFDKKTWRL